ncbi:hypothetical protein [Phytohabitans suffuscus]|uniref:Secreted protein n=1 Tax=Phytohabitans suffuscus TaxID=624315 RepID=A0A6F8YT56_9ACTN|nr:hypothetical protein [Phytohabitans suffuscus]BCB89317.1 hypothetical protein Psuf_066300 [Phytohabitans suffuscus]
MKVNLRSSRAALALRRGALAIALAVAAATGSLAVAQPASASTWHVVSQSTSCYTYSFGTLCTVKTHSFRAHDSYCNSYNPDPTNWYRAFLTSLSMYQYCYRYSETTYWP